MMIGASGATARLSLYRNNHEKVNPWCSASKSPFLIPSDKLPTPIPGRPLPKRPSEYPRYTQRNQHCQTAARIDDNGRFDKLTRYQHANQEGEKSGEKGTEYA
jgi:hypothetical protein